MFNSRKYRKSVIFEYPEAKLGFLSILKRIVDTIITVVLVGVIIVLVIGILIGFSLMW